MSRMPSDYLDIEDAQNRRNAAALAAARFGVFEYEPKTQLAFWDDRIRELFGAKPDDHINYDYVLAQIHPDDRDYHNEATARALDPEGPGTMDIEYRLLAREDQPEKWIRAKAKCKFENGVAIRLVGTVEDITLRKTAEQRNEMLFRELQHRLKNTMAVVASIADQSRYLYDSVDELADALMTRLKALARAQEILRDNDWSDVGLSHICDQVFASFSDDQTRLRATWNTDIVVPEQYVLTTSLAIYELTSNSMKYGSLSRHGGYVVVSGDTVGGSKTFRWQEVGGPATGETEFPETGFGSYLLRNVWPAELGGTCVYRGTPEGAVYSLTLA